MTSVKKNTVNYSVFGHLTLKNHGICSGFCFSPRKNIVNNSNFAVFSCFWTALVRYTWLSNSSRFFFLRQSVLSDVLMVSMATSLAFTSGREGVRTTSFKPWRPHRGSCRGATAIEENNGSRREQWLTSLTVWTVHSICTYMIFIYIYISLYLSVWAQRCGAGGCRREATWINVSAVSTCFSSTLRGFDMKNWAASQKNILSPASANGEASTQDTPKLASHQMPMSSWRCNMAPALAMAWWSSKTATQPVVDSSWIVPG